MSAIRHAATNASRALIRPDRFTLLLIAIAVLGAGLVLARQITYGVTLWGDSLYYISTARGLLEGEGLTALWSGAPLQTKPPLYPMMLTIGSLGLFDPWDVSGPFNAICHGLTVLVAGQWLRRHVRSSLLAIWGSLAIAISLPLIAVAGAAAAEAPFYLLTTLALSRFSAWSEEPKRATLLQAGVFTALACLTRYPGVALIPIFVLLLLLQRDSPVFVKARRIAAYVLISGIPLALYLIRNYFIFGSITPNIVDESRREGIRSVPAILEETIRYIGEWIAPGLSINETIHLIVSSILLLLIIAGFSYFARIREEKYPFSIFMATHSAAIMISINAGGLAFGFEERYATMLYIPFIFILSALVDEVIHVREWSIFRIPEHLPVFGGITGIAIIVFLLLYGWVGYNTKLNEEEIRLFNSDQFYRAVEDDSEFLTYMASIETGMIWGNVSALTAYFYAEKRANEYGLLPNEYDDLSEFIDSTEIGEYIAWSQYPAPHAQADYTFAEIKEGIDGLDFVASVLDGNVLQVSKRTNAEKYAAITSREPDIISEFNIYLSGNKLSFIREPCLRSEIQDTVYVHIIPRNVSDLPEKFMHSSIENLDFRFRTAGVIFDGICMATIPLPDYQITTIYTGVHASGTHFWRGQFHPSFDTFPDPAVIWSATLEPPLDTARLQGDYDAITSGAPVVQSFYSVWIDGPYISYTREPCERDDTTALFFLHVYPDDDDDLPDERKPDVDFDNLDFVFEPATGSVRFDGKCIATRILPDYPIASIRTGQYDARGDIWSVDISR